MLTFKMPNRTTPTLFKYTIIIMMLLYTHIRKCSYTVAISCWEAVFQEINHHFGPWGDCNGIPLVYVQICQQGHPSAYSVGCPVCYDLVINILQVGCVHGATSPLQLLDTPDITAVGGASPYTAASATAL